MLVSEKNNNDIVNCLLKKRVSFPQYVPKEDMLHVWCISLNGLHQYLSVLHQNLSKDECSRAGKYHFRKDRDHFILRRGILRTLISNYLEVDPHHIQFCYGKRGKPGIANNCSDKRLNFNMAHSKNLLLYAFSSKREVGIDLEHVRPIPEVAQIVETYFSNKEKKVFSGLPANQQKTFFFQLWSRKEAFLKATGKGLNQPMNSFDVISPDGFMQIQSNLEAVRWWNIEDLFPASGFSAAYAVEGGPPLKSIHYKYLCF